MRRLDRGACSNRLVLGHIEVIDVDAEERASSNAVTRRSLAIVGWVDGKMNLVEFAGPVLNLVLMHLVFQSNTECSEQVDEFLGV